MRFNYQARTKEGEVQTGTVESSSREVALDLLEKYGLYVTFLEEAEALPIFYQKVRIFERISKKEVVVFSRQLAIMFKANIPVVEAFHTLAKQTKNLNFKEKIINIAEDIEGGMPVSRALSRYPKIFSSFYTSVIKSGEASGELAETLEYLAEHLEREYDFRSKLLGAIIYPAFVLAAALVIIILMAFFVIPPLRDVFLTTGAQIPLITKLIFNFSIFLKKWGIFVLIGFLLIIFLVFRYSKTAEGKKFFDKIFLKLPLIGDFLQKVYLARLAENLSTLVSGGLPIAQALEITGEVVGNEVYKSIIFRARDEVRKGEAISATFERYPEFIPPLVVQMTFVGERSGRLAPSLIHIVNFYKKEVDRTLANFISFLEPVLIIFLGGIVFLIVASVILPIYRVGIM